MTSPDLRFLVPGPIGQRTGGYVYDARIVDGLRRRGRRVAAYELDGDFPAGDARARTSLAGALARLPDGARVVVDGLAMGGLPEPVRAERRRLRVIALVHLLLADETGLDAGRRARFAALEREALAACTGVLATSAYTAARVRELGLGAVADAVRAVPPGTDPAPPAAGPGPDAPPQILCVASVTPRKGQDVLMRALASLAELPWRCVCAGSLTRAPAFARAVMRQVRDAGLVERVAFPGECDAAAVDALYDASSLFVLPSHFEGFGMVLTEAMARGLPVVGTTGGAVPHVVPASAGLLVPPGDADALAGALRKLLADAPAETPGRVADRRRRMAAAARRHASNLPDWDQAAGAFAGAVAELTGGARR